MNLLKGWSGCSKLEMRHLQMYLEVSPSRVCSQTMYVLEITALHVQEMRRIRVSFDTLNHDRCRVRISIYGLGKQLQ